MKETNLKYELSKRIFGHLGAVSGMREGIGAILDGAIIPCELSIRDRDDGSVQKFPIYAVINSRGEKLILSNIGDNQDPEMILVAEHEQVTLGLYLNFENKANGFWVWNSMRETWIPLSVQHILILAAAFEDITQSGVLWEPYSAWQPMYDWLLKLADFVVEVS